MAAGPVIPLPLRMIPTKSNSSPQRNETPSASPPGVFCYGEQTMNNIDTAEALARALDSPIDPRVRRLLRLRRDQLLANTGGEYDLGELAQFIVVEPYDTIDEIEVAAGYPVITSQAFEWVTDHAGILEAPAILSDDGFGVVLIVPVVEGVDRTLVSLLRSYAQAVSSDAPSNAEDERPLTP